MSAIPVGCERASDLPDHHDISANQSIAISRSNAVIECPIGSTWWVRVAPARINRPASLAPSPGDLRLSFSPSMINTGVPDKRAGRSSVTVRAGETGWGGQTT